MSAELIAAAAVTSRFIVAFVLLVAAIPKLFSQDEFEQAVRNYELLPSPLVRPFARWLPRLELLCGLMLLAGIAVAPVAVAAGALLIAFSAAVAINLARGREIDCGCSGAVSARRIGWTLVTIDLGLAAMALLAGLRDPGILAIVPVGASESSLTDGDGLAFLVLAGSVVVGCLTTAAWRNLRTLSSQLRQSLEAAR